MELHRAGKEYLKTILALEQKNGSVRSLDVARTLHVTKPSVSKAMKHLREGGYLTMDADKRICLTKAGREAAEAPALPAARCPGRYGRQKGILFPDPDSCGPPPSGRDAGLGGEQL